MAYKTCKTCGGDMSQGRAIRCRPCAMDHLGDERADANVKLSEKMHAELRLVSLVENENERAQRIDGVCVQFQISHSSLARRMKACGDEGLASELWRREKYWRPRGGWQGCLDADARASVAAWIAEAEKETS